LNRSGDAFYRQQVGHQPALRVFAYKWDSANIFAEIKIRRKLHETKNFILAVSTTWKVEIFGGTYFRVFGPSREIKFRENYCFTAKISLIHEFQVTITFSLILVKKNKLTPPFSWFPEKKFNRENKFRETYTFWHIQPRKFVPLCLR